MKSNQHQRETGSSLIIVIVALTFTLALAGAVSLVTTNGLRATSRSTARMDAFYAADAAAQVGNALVRSTGMSMQATSFQETIGGHAAQVDITEEDVGLYRVTSTTNVGGEVSTVELWVNFQQDPILMDPQGGFEAGIGNQVNLNGDLRVQLDGNARISGYDHDKDGNELDDQTDGVPGLAMQDTPGDRTFWTDTSGDSEIVGVPEAIVNDAENQTDLLNTIRDVAQSNADVFVTGSTLLDEESNGNFGTADDPVLVYVSLGQNDQLTLDSSFQGHGFLVVDAGKNAEFAMHGDAQWNGMILFRAHGDPSTGNGPLIEMDGNATILGSLQLLLDIAGTHANGHKVISLDDHAQVLFSSSMIEYVLKGDEDTEGVPLNQTTGVKTFRR